MSRLKSFGHGCKLHELGYTITAVTGYLEALIDSEEENGADHLSKTQRGKRLSKAYDALQLLNDIVESGNES
jgi:hypothetical protein